MKHGLTFFLFIIQIMMLEISVFVNIYKLSVKIFPTLLIFKPYEAWGYQAKGWFTSWGGQSRMAQDFIMLLGTRTIWTNNMFISRIFSLIFSDLGWQRVTETMESRIVDKGGLLCTLSRVANNIFIWSKAVVSGKFIDYNSIFIISKYI